MHMQLKASLVSYGAIIVGDDTSWIWSGLVHFLRRYADVRLALHLDSLVADNKEL